MTKADPSGSGPLATTRPRGRPAASIVQAPADWTPSLRADFAANQRCGRVGQTLVSETARVRVWTLRLQPGERFGFHRHVLDYFWTAVTAGRARSHYHAGRVAEVTYHAGDTRHLAFAAGEFVIHDLENIGDTELVFTTVEFLDSPNSPLPISPGSRAEAPESRRATRRQSR